MKQVNFFTDMLLQKFKQKTGCGLKSVKNYVKIRLCIQVKRGKFMSKKFRIAFGGGAIAAKHVI